MPADAAERPLVVGLGGTTRPGSSTERLLRVVLDAAASAGAETRCFGAEALVQLPMYAPEQEDRSDPARALVDALARADGVILASPGYHGGVSGLVKNALDYVEDLRDDARPYLDGRPVGCIATAAGPQAAVTTLMALRATVHALRGWPTPLGVTVGTAPSPFDADGELTDAQAAARLAALGAQVVDFCRWRRPAGASA